MVNELMNFLHMGGYAAYLWPAYGLMALIFVINLFVPWYKHRYLEKSQNQE